MKGGLLQLATVGKADSILINNPQLFHFKKVYMKYTNFSIDNNSQIIGEKKFDTNFEITLRKNGDLLKDVFFYLEIPYFDIIKKINKKTSQFDRTESDKLYYDYLNMKAFIYYTGNDQYYIIPENVLYINSKNKKNELDTFNILAINSSDYSSYYNNSSNFKEIIFDDNIKHHVIPFMKTVDSEWFNNLINKISIKNFQVTVMDKNLFSSWITDKVDNRLFLNYQNIFNLNQFKSKYQINFDTSNDKKTNEIKKYFEIINQMDNLDKSTYILEGLDIDNAMSLILSNKQFEIGSDELIEYLENTILYSSRFILYILKKLYDDNIGNYFTFYNMYSTAYTTDNTIISKNNRTHDITDWDNYINDGFIANFDSKSSVQFKSGFWDKFINTSNLIEKDINNMWNSIDLDFNNIEFIYSVIYTFIDRYENFNNFNTINFLDFFVKEGEDGFFKKIEYNYGNYSDITKTNLTTVYNKYGSKFDLTLIYNYIVYQIAYHITEFNIFENFNSINKQNIQFIYWWRNKIANMVFLRYKRIQGKSSNNGNFYPDFTNIKESTELINMFYTFIPNNIISLNEIKNDLYRLFNNNSYIGVSTNDINIPTSFRTLSKITTITNETYNKDYTGTIDAQYSIKVTFNDFTKSDRIISFVSPSNKVRRSFFDKKFKLELLYNSNYYLVTSSYSNGQTKIILDKDIIITSDFDLVVTLYMPINKYYIDYTPLKISKNNLTFDTNNNRLFTSNTYINTDIFNFTLESAPEGINSTINLHTNTTTVNNIQHEFNLTNNNYLSADLFDSTKISNYNIKIYKKISYENTVNISNFSISSSTINDVLYNILTIDSTTVNYFNYNSTYIYYISYNNTDYLITLLSINGSGTSFKIRGDPLPLDLLESNNQTYKLIEWSPIISSVSVFVLDPSSKEIILDSDASNIDSTNMNFTYTGANINVDKQNLLYQNNRYYHVNIINSDTTYYVTTPEKEDIDLNGAKLYSNSNIYFSDNTSLSTLDEYYINYIKTSDNVITEKIKITPVLENGSNFTDENKFKYQIESIDNNNYNNLINNDSLTFNIEGTVIYDDNIILFYKKIDTTTNKYLILENKFINNNLLRIVFDNNKNYFLKIEYLDSSKEKKRIVFNKTESLNDIYFSKETEDTYSLPLDFNNIAQIYLETIPFVHEEFVFSGKISVKPNLVNYNYLKIKNESSNLENYHKFVKNGNNTYYIKTETRIINLGPPSTDDTYITFKILNPEGDFTTDIIDKDYKIIVFVNNYLPNLINYTSFYLLDNEEKSYDLMDYFIQTPMILFLDKSTTKDGNIILYNLPIDTELMDELKYLKLNDEYLHINEKINSNQILRYETNLVSSSFDYDIIAFDNANYIGKENLITDIESAIAKELDSYDINKIIDTIETTNSKAIHLFQNNGLENINNGVFGKTIEQLLKTFNNNNIISLLNEKNISIDTSKFNYNILNPFKYEDYNLYSKMVIDFYSSDGGVSYDSQLNLSLNSSTGQSIFITNYKPLLLSNKLNIDMLDFLENYKTEINKQLVYIKSNLLWYDIGSTNINNNFGYFYDFQQNYRNYIYNEKSGKDYNYKYLFDNHFDIFEDLDKKTFYGKDEIVMGESTINSTLELKPVRKTIEGVIKENNNSIYKYKKNTFNYLGPGLIKDGVIINDSIKYNYDSSKDYMFVDDISGCYKITHINSQEFKINDNTNKMYKDSYVMEITNSKIDIGLINSELYLYEFKNIVADNLSDNNYILIDNVICKVISTDYNNGNIALISSFNLDIDSTKYFMGTLKTSNYTYTDSSDILLENNMTNLFNFSNIKFTLGELVNIKHFNKKTTNYDSQKIYCSEGDGILRIENVDNKDYVYITDEVIYELSNNVIEKKPMKLKNGIVSYHNILKDLTPDTYIYNEDIIKKLKDMPDAAVPENLWFLNGELDEILIRLNTIIDTDLNKIELPDEEYSEMKSLYMYYNNNFHKISDFTATNVDFSGSINKNIFYIDNKIYDNSHPIEVISGRTYIFNNSHDTNIGHPFRFSTTKDGTHTSGTTDESEVTYYPTASSNGTHYSYVKKTFPNNESTMYYYCTNHQDMGGVITVTKGLVNYDVTVELGTNGLIFYIDNKIYNSTNPLLLEGNKKYRFNYSDSTNIGHPLRFSTTENGTHNGGVEYTTDVTTNGTVGSTGSYIEIIGPINETNLYFYCSNHSGMGGQLNINNSDIHLNVKVGQSPGVFILNENSFNVSKDFYTYKVKNNSNITYNVMTNTTNLAFTELNNFEIPDYQRYLVSNNMNYTHDVNLLFVDTSDTSITRPINVQVTDSNNKINRLLYNVYSDNSFSSEIDSVYKIPASEIDSSNTLKNDSLFYLQFDLSSAEPITIGNLTEYYLNKEKISYVNIESHNHDIKVLKLDSNGSEYEFKISSGTKFIKGDFKRFDFNVNFIYNDNNYNFNIIMRVITDDNYQQTLKMDYTGSYEFLHEPYLITGGNSNKLKNSNNNTFIGCIPEIFTSTDGSTIIENNNISLTDIKSYENNITYMDIDIEPNNAYYKEHKMKEKISLNDKINYWELIDKVNLYDNMILINESNQEIINKVSSIILFVNNRCYYVNIIEKKDNYILIDHKFESFNNSAILYVNLFEGIKVDVPIFLNTKIKIIYSSFGEFKIGQIIEISHLKLLIKDYDLIYHGYSFDIIIEYDFKNISPYYSSYYSLGLINNYDIKNNLVNLEQDNKLLSKNKENINFGDFIVSNKNIGYYDNETVIFYDDTLNYGFNHNGFDIKLTFLNNQWLYFGSELGTNIKIVAQYRVSGVSKSKILIIKYILNNVVFWKEDEDLVLVLANLTIKYKDGYFFYYPYQPFHVKYLKIENNCSVNFNGNGVIDIGNEYYLIDNGSILNYDKPLVSNYYSIIFLEETETEFSDYSTDIYPFQKELFYDISFYRSNTIYYDGVDSSNVGIADIGFNKDSSYYYYDSLSKKYTYPIYLIKTSKDQTSTVVLDIPIYYSNVTTSIDEPNSNLGHINLDVHINSSYYILENNKYYYPLYLNVNILNSNKEDNLLKNIKVDCNIVNTLPTISFESKPNTFGYLGQQYSYNIITEPSNCKITSLNLPIWLTLNGEPGNYSLSGIPEINDTNNDIHLVAEYNKSSTIQTFKINIPETNTSLIFTSTPLTYVKTGDIYTYNVSATPNISSIKAISIPIWLTLSNNTLSGMPNHGNIGANTIILEATDSSNNIVKQEFDILVNNNYVPYITSNPPTTVSQSTVYTYDISYNENGNTNIDLSTIIIPSWLTLSNSTLTGTTPSSNGDHLVVIKISENNIFSEQIFTIKVTDSDTIKFYSNPKTYGYVNDEYIYPIRVSDSSNNSVIFEYDIVGINLPTWLSIDDHMNLRGVPGFCYLGENTITIQAKDIIGNTETQTFSIYIIENQNKIIRLNNGVFENIIKNIHFDYHTKILINSSYYTLRNIVNYVKYSEIYVDEYIDLSGENIITFPVNFSHSKKELINDHCVNITDTHIGYNYHIDEPSTDSKLFCYFTNTNQTQIQIRTFNITNLNDNRFTTTDKLFNLFFNDLSNTVDIFIENYYPISIILIEDLTYHYKVLPFNITTTKNILIQEKYNDEIFIHYAKLEFKDGLLKIANNISNNDSEFFINKIIPIRIRDNIVQLINPIVYQNLYYGINSRETVDNWISVPIKFTSKPLMENNKWKVEVSTKYLFLLDKYDIYDKLLIYDNSGKILFKIADAKHYLFYNSIPKMDKNVVYIRKKDFFEYLTKSNNVLKSEDELSGKGYNDTYLTRFLGNDWKLHTEKVIIPINVSKGDIRNHYIVDKDFNIDNINLKNNDIEYYLYNENNKIISSGITSNNTIELTSSVKVSDITSSINLYISTKQSSNIINDIFEVKPSVNTLLDIVENTGNADKFNFNSCKTFEDWTSITFNDNISYKNNKQNKLIHLSADSSGNVSTNADIHGSLLLYEEAKSSSKLKEIVHLLSNNNFKNYEILMNIRKVEDIIFNYIDKVSDNYSFWNDPIKNINSYLEKYDGELDTKNYMIYKNCIVTKDEIDNNIINNTDIFKNNNNLVRIAYLDSQFTINKTSTLKVYRYKKQINSVINKFVNNIDLKFFGSDSHLVLQKISELYLSKGTFMEYLKDGESFNFRYDILTLEKILISKQWETILDKDKEMYQLFNTEFNDKLSISYDKDPNYEINGLYNGILDSEFGSKPFGLDSYNKIIKNDFTQEELLYDAYPLNINDYTNPETIHYRLESNDIFKYQIRSTDDIQFKPEYNYKLNILEGKNVINNIDINITNYYSNLIEFTSNEEYRDYNDISLIIENNYSILNTEFIGYYYEALTINDLSSGDIFLKIDFHDIIINNYETSTTDTKFNIISPILITNDKYIKIEKIVGINKQEFKNIDEEDRLYITFTKNFNKSNFKNAGNEIYLNVNDSIYQVYTDSSGFDYIIGISELINMYSNYAIFFYYQFNNIESLKTSNYIYNLELDKDLDNIGYKTSTPLNINYNVDNIGVSNIEIIDTNKITVFVDTILTAPEKLNNTFKIEKRNPILVNSIDTSDNFYLTEILNDISILENNSSITLKRTGYTDISGVLYSYTNDNNFIFQTNEFYTASYLSDYETEIVNIINITTYEYSENILSFISNSNITLIFNEHFKYYVDISGSYYLIDNSKIYIQGNIMMLDLTGIGTITPNNTFNFKQVSTENRISIHYEYNRLLNVGLSKNFINNKSMPVTLKYLTNNNKEIGNFIYSFPKSDIIVNLTYNYKLRTSLDNSIDIFLIGEYNNRIYFSTINKLDSGDYEYKFYSTNYDVNENIRKDDVLFQSNTNFNSIIIKNIDTNKFNIGIEILEDQSLILFPNDTTNSVNLFIIPYNTTNSNLDLIMISDKKYSFPEKLDYENYKIELNTSETKKEEIIWDEDYSKKIFSDIDLYFNDQRIDSINENISKINDLYLDKNKKINNKPVLKDGKFYLYLPLVLWFNQSSSNYLPLIALENTLINLKVRVNSFRNLINNNLDNLISELPNTLSIQMCTDTILLGSKERQNFAEYNHEYLIQRNVALGNTLIRDIIKTVNIPIKGLVKDIFWILKSRDTNKNYLSIETVERDVYYQDFLTTKNIYNEYIKNNREFNDNIPTSYKEKFNIMQNIYNMIDNDDGTGIVNIIKTNQILLNYDNDFILYIYFAYLSYYDNYNDSYFGTTTEAIINNRLRSKLSKLFTYLKYTFKDTKKIIKKSPIKNLNFKVNGRSLLSENNFRYYNSVLPYQKMNRSPDLGIGMYSFSLYPTLEQPSGELNFNILKNPTLELEMDKLVYKRKCIFNHSGKRIPNLKNY